MPPILCEVLGTWTVYREHEVLVMASAGSRLLCLTTAEKRMNVARPGYTLYNAGETKEIDEHCGQVQGSPLGVRHPNLPLFPSVFIETMVLYVP